MTIVNQLISQIPSKFEFEIPSKVEISLVDSVALFACGFVSYGILSKLFNKIKNVHLEREVRNLEALRKDDEERHEQEMEQLNECHNILRKMDARKLANAESRISDLIKAHRALEDFFRSKHQALKALEEKYNDLELRYENVVSLHEITSSVDEAEYETENEDEAEYENEYEDENETEYEDEYEDENEAENEDETEDEDEDEDEDEYEDEDEDEDEDETENVVQVRRLWTNEEKANGTYADQLPNGFKAYLNSCNKTMNLTFKKGNSKDENRWIVNETGIAYPSLNQARAAFFGDKLKTKQSVWLSVRSAQDGRRLRNVIEGN